MLPKTVVLLIVGQISLVHDTMDSTWACATILSAHHNHRIEIIGIVNEISLSILAALEVDCVWI